MPSKVTAEVAEGEIDVHVLNRLERSADSEFSVASGALAPLEVVVFPSLAIEGDPSEYEPEDALRRDDAAVEVDAVRSERSELESCAAGAGGTRATSARVVLPTAGTLDAEAVALLASLRSARPATWVAFGLSGLP